MARYQITNTASGVVFGIYEGADEAEALDAYARDAGYADFAAACEVASGDDIVATEVSAADGGLPTSPAAQHYLLGCLHVGIERAAEDHVLAVKAIADQDALAAKTDRDFLEDMLLDPASRAANVETAARSAEGGNALLAMWRRANGLPVDAGTMEIIWRQECDNARRRLSAVFPNA